MLLQHSGIRTRVRMFPPRFRQLRWMRQDFSVVRVVTRMIVPTVDALIRRTVKHRAVARSLACMCRT